MIQINKILCPVDFFPASEFAAMYAGGLAQAFDAKLKLLHVISPMVPTAYEYPLNMADVVAGMEEASARELDKLVKKFKTPDLDIDTDVRTGEIVRTIKSVVTDYKPDLIAMGTHGRKSLGRWFLGSTTERLLRQSPVPLLTISTRKGRIAGAAFRRILVTTDFSEGTTDALKYAFSLAQENQARMTLLHVMQETGQGRDKEVVCQLREELENLVPNGVRDWCTVETRLDWGAPPYRRILDMVAKEEIDLLVMNIHGKGMFERAILGSNAERVVRGASCPVLLVPPLKIAKAKPGKRAA
jgi:nucleotide-binding universal stress UspA family protein